jgi:hypothetical protein
VKKNIFTNSIENKMEAEQKIKTEKELVLEGCEEIKKEPVFGLGEEIKPVFGGGEENKKKRKVVVDESAKNEKMKMTETEEEKQDKIVDLFESIDWDILASTDLPCYDQEIDLKLPFMLLPVSNSGSGLEYVGAEDCKMEFSSVKEVLDFIANFYKTSPKALQALFERDTDFLLTGYFCHIVNNPRDTQYTELGWTRIFTKNATTSFGGVYFTQAGGLVLKLEKY